MSEPAGGGLRLDGAPRTSACGRWYSATTGDGRRRGALLIDPALLATDGALDPGRRGGHRAVRRLKLPGVLRMADLLDHGGRTWLITEAPARPTVAKLIATGTAIDPASAALLVSDTGQTLHLHQAGVAHGAVGPDTVVVTAAGAGSLVEVGLAAALRGVTADPGADITAWAALVRTVAQSCPPAADLFNAVA